MLHTLASRRTAAREGGALVALTRALYFLAMAEITAGALGTADAHFAESRDVMAARGDTGGLGPLVARAWQGREAETREAATAATVEAARRGQGGVAVYADYALGVLELGLGHYAEALQSERRVYAADSYFLCPIAIPDLVEACARGGDRALAIAAVERLSARATNSDTPLARGLAARGTSPGRRRRRRRGALHRVGRGVVRRRCRRAPGALPSPVRGVAPTREAPHRGPRTPTSRAPTIFEEIGAEAFAARARTELRATGEHARRRADETRNDLTPQESQIAKLAAAGATNHEIACPVVPQPEHRRLPPPQGVPEARHPSRRQLRER